MKHKFKRGDLVTVAYKVSFATNRKRYIPNLYIILKTRRHSYRDTLVVELYCINNGTRHTEYESYINMNHISESLRNHET